MSYLQIAEALWPEGEVGAELVKKALHLRGYRRRVALRKPPISEANREARLQWAYKHLHWSEQQWRSILWSDETWVKAETHRKILVTRKPGEELNETCVTERIQRQLGWMFWACFFSNIKGPSIFWEKDWGTINQESYQAHIVPIIYGWCRMHPHLLFMQDNAPGHAAKATLEDLNERGVNVIFWPAFSPDLNPIETLWNRMKDWLAINYPSKKASYDQLRAHLKEAWEVIGQDTLDELIRTMPERCQAVIDANGLHTKW